MMGRGSAHKLLKLQHPVGMPGLLSAIIYYFNSIFIRQFFRSKFALSNRCGVSVSKPSYTKLGIRLYCKRTEK